jgi:hypothetical protein
LDTSNPRNIG